MNCVLGIDFGTSYSRVSYVDSHGKAVVIRNCEGEQLTPSVVMVETQNKIIVGNEAKRNFELELGKTSQFIKRKIGKKDDTVKLNGITYHATEIVSMILKKIVSDANKELRQMNVLESGEEIKNVVITCPSNYGLNERRALGIAGELAGLNVINIINESTAAAISYGTVNNEDYENVLVYDLGGGSFDVSLIEIDGKKINVICSCGDDKLGGKDWDEELIFYLIKRYQEVHGQDLFNDPQTVASLFEDAENWKKALTTRKKVNIVVNGFSGRFREELSREKYEDITKKLLDRTKKCIDEVLKEARIKGYAFNNIDKVLLVGGASRMPQVTSMIEQKFRLKTILLDPDEAVAKGTALYANYEKEYIESCMRQNVQLNENLTLRKDDSDSTLSVPKAKDGERRTKFDILNVLSKTYGIALCTGEEPAKEKIYNIFRKNERLPIMTKKTFYKTGQNEMDIDIFESTSVREYMYANDIAPIAKIKMKFEKVIPSNTQIDVTFIIDNSGILNVMAEELKYNTSIFIEYQLSNQMIQKDYCQAMQRMSFVNIE